MSSSQPDTVVYPAAVLRVPPDVVSGLRRAVDETLAELTPHLKRMQDEAFIDRPWLDDPISGESCRVYNENVMASHEGPFNALLLYQEQLRTISQRLAEVQRNYDEAEAANSDLVRRMA